MSCDFSREPSVGLPSRSLGEFKSEGSRCWRIPQSGLQSRRESQADNTQTRADGSWDRQGGTNSSWCHLSRCPLTAPSAVTTSAWAWPLGGDEPGPPALLLLQVTGAASRPKLRLVILPEACSLPLLRIPSEKHVFSFGPVFPAPQTWVSAKQLHGLKKIPVGSPSRCWLSELGQVPSSL